MKTNLIKTMLVISSLIAFGTVANAKIPISFSGQIGYVVPQGNGFETEVGDKSRFGIGVDLDLMWHLARTNYKFGAGITANGSFLFGNNKLEDYGDIGLMGLSLYGVKMQYRFFNTRVSPYISLSAGVAQLTTPEVTLTMGGEVIAHVPSETSSSLGIRPEFGIDISGLLLSVAYVVPMNYDALGGTAGALQVSLGARISLFDRE